MTAALLDASDLQNLLSRAQTRGKDRRRSLMELKRSQTRKKTTRHRALEDVKRIIGDLCSLDPDTLATRQPLHALIFLFKYISPSGSSAPFGSAGILDLDLLASSRTRRDTSADWPRAAHNAPRPPAAISLDGLGLDPGEKEDVYHFVVYVPVSNSLFALRDDPLPALQAQFYPALQQQSGHHATASELPATLDAENTTRGRWAFENALRRYNHIGLLHTLLARARSGKLTAVDAAHTMMRETRQKLPKGGAER
ncbi:hypothetical protein FIBSPDRAFT_1050092 [Athelia psychrophila]|uniref:UCH37-like C-terminal domain-containing protein n=1 Tax=Athelia psychrophila TaxID=1759441 RepID=A0A166B838_9AGAM|nr:hypothetical protein FIBSPDRAFT_1050092 [Fibularhizoctonia sp. CBS 109695]